MRHGKRPLRILISAGPTREPIDPVRFLSNYSTGYMGAQVAAQALKRRHHVTVVAGPMIETLPAAARVIRAERADQMERALHRHARSADVIIMAAAVADFRVARPANVKLRRQGHMTLRLEATPDILARLPRRRHQLIVGFALETNRVLTNAMKKLQTKRLDLVLAQHASARHSPFGHTRVRAWLLDRRGRTIALGLRTKATVACALLDKVEGLWYGQTHA